MPQRPASTRRRAGPAQQAQDRLQQHLERLGLSGLDLDPYFAWLKAERRSDLEAAERLLGMAAALLRERSINWRIKASGLIVRKTLATFDWTFQPKLDRRLVEGLFDLDFVERHEDLLLTGKSGTGKSHILQALTLKSCEQEWLVRYSRCVDLIDDLYAGLADNTYERRMKRWCRPTLLVIDDVGLGQLKRRDDEPTAAHMLFTLLDRRHTLASTAISSNIKLSLWGQYLGDATLAAAVLDRLAANSIRIDIDGPSYRQFLARQRAGQADPLAPANGEQTSPPAT